jgi:cyclophilin family peptidyl-prolyl cis-trans isomerase
MARGGAPGSAAGNFFIPVGAAPSMDARGANPGYAAFGRVVSGMDVVDKIYDGYGEGAPRGKGPEQGRIQAEGNAYLTKDFPRLDYIKTATIVP